MTGGFLCWRKKRTRLVSLAPPITTLGFRVGGACSSSSMETGMSKSGPSSSERSSSPEISSNWKSSSSSVVEAAVHIVFVVILLLFLLLALIVLIVFGEAAFAPIRVERVLVSQGRRAGVLRFEAERAHALQGRGRRVGP
ncbi:hypothetical protein CRUP_009141 [Coryphaenoides rupestris]|nr:hypothetical protein CRUP_009141 [Coryphaenoides rupestris]